MPAKHVDEHICFEWIEVTRCDSVVHACRCVECGYEWYDRCNCAQVALEQYELR